MKGKLRIKSKIKGFSLVEVTISLLIIAVLLTIGFITFMPEKLKYDQYANGFVNLLYRAKMAAIFNLYNSVLIYNINTGIFEIFIDENMDDSRDPNERIIHRFPNNLDFLRRGRTRIGLVRNLNRNGWTTLIMLNNETNIIIFNRLGYAVGSRINRQLQLVEIYLRNQNVENRYRYQYVVRVTSGGDIRLIRRNL